MFFTNSLILILGVVFLGIYAAPVAPDAEKPVEGVEEPKLNEEYMNLEYKKYLDEVVALLEGDDNFKRELEKMETNADQQEQSSQISKYLQFAHKNTRAELDELKRKELRRLKDVHRKLVREMAAKLKAEGKRAPPEGLPKVDLDHMDHGNPHTFEEEDLKKLIKKTTDDLAELDKKRRSEFKNYELNKEHEYRDKLKHAANEEEAEKLKAEHEESVKHHKDHPKVNHPGNKKQLEEVWEEEDNMEPEQFNPRTFFMLHDVDQDGYLSIPEIEALFQTELDKVYNESDPADDPVERQEEMNRMREHILNEVDKDGDGMLSFDEFMDSTKSEDFDKSEEWDTLDDDELFNNKEFDAFEGAVYDREAEFQKQHAGNDGSLDNGQGNQQPVDGNPEHKNNNMANDHINPAPSE